MDPTAVKRSPLAPRLRLGEPLAAAIWMGLIASVLFVGSDWLAGTLRSSAFRSLGAAFVAGLFGLVAASLSLSTARSRRRAAEPNARRVRWRSERLPVLAMAVLPPLVIGLMMRPAGSILGSAWLAVQSLAVSVLLMSDRIGRWPRSLTGDDLAKLVRAAMPREKPASPVEARPVVNLSAVTGAAPLLACSPVAAAPPKPEPVPYAVFDPDAAPVDEAGEEGIVFTMTRRVVDGADRLEGSFRIEFPAGRRLASFHVPFVPPFPTPPEVQCEMTDGDESIRVKVGLVLAWGVRFDARRAEADDDAFLVVAFHAGAAGEETGAA